MGLTNKVYAGIVVASSIISAERAYASPYVAPNRDEERVTETQPNPRNDGPNWLAVAGLTGLTIWLYRKATQNPNQDNNQPTNRDNNEP